MNEDVVLNELVIVLYLNDEMMEMLDQVKILMNENLVQRRMEKIDDSMKYRFNLCSKLTISSMFDKN
jgi:hypothetical protein